MAISSDFQSFIDEVIEKNDTPQIRGMLKQVDYMIEVVE